MSGFPGRGADLRGSPGNFRGSPGNFWGSPGNFRGTSGLLLSSTVRERPGKSPGKLPGKLGELPGKSRDFPEAWGSLTPSQRLAKFVSKQQCFERFLALRFESCHLESLWTGGDSKRSEPRTEIRDIYKLESLHLAPKPFKNRYLGTSGLQIGAPQKRQILPRRI